MAIDDGGAAFPEPDDAIPGMTLRDYFAGHALMGWIAESSMKRIMEVPPKTGMSGEQLESWAMDVLANGCYRMSDAMLKAREVK